MPPISSENISSPALPNVPAIPATVATSFRWNRSDDIVITVTDSVWCAKPPRLEQRDRGVRALHHSDECHRDHQQRAERECASPRVDERQTRSASAACIATMPPKMQPKSAARKGIHANIAICFRSMCRTRVR